MPSMSNTTVTMRTTPKSLPPGFEWGTIRCDPSGNERYIIRISDSASALVPEGDARTLRPLKIWVSEFNEHHK